MTDCYVCGDPCEGTTGAVIDDVFQPMCHEDGDDPTCYELWQWRGNGLSFMENLESLLKPIAEENPTVLVGDTEPACARRGCGRPWAEHDFGLFCP